MIHQIYTLGHQALAKADSVTYLPEWVREISPSIFSAAAYRYILQNGYDRTHLTDDDVLESVIEDALGELGLLVSLDNRDRNYHLFHEGGTFGLSLLVGVMSIYGYRGNLPNFLSNVMKGMLYPVEEDVGCRPTELLSTLRSIVDNLPCETHDSL